MAAIVEPTVWQHQVLVNVTNESTAGVVNAIFVFVTFLLSLPALFLPTNRGWLRTQGWLVVVCATFTLGLGLAIWVETLETRKHLSDLWGREPPLIQSLLQQKVRTLHTRLRHWNDPQLFTARGGFSRLNKDWTCFECGNT